MTTTLRVVIALAVAMTGCSAEPPAPSRPDGPPEPPSADRMRARGLDEPFDDASPAKPAEPAASVPGRTFERRATIAAGGWVLDAALAPDGRQVAVGQGWGDGVLVAGVDLAAAPRTISLRALEPEAEDAEFEEGEVDSLHVPSVAWSPDGTFLACGTSFASGAVVHVPSGRVEPLEGCRAAAFAPDGALLAVGDAQGRVRLLDTRPPWKELRALPAAPQTVERLVFSPDGARLAIAAQDGVPRVVSVAGSKVLATLATGDYRAPRAIAFTPDGGHLVTASFQGVRLFDAATGALVRALSDEACHSVAVSRDGRLVACGAKAIGDKFGPSPVLLLELPSGREVARLAGHTRGVLAVCFLPDGRLLSGGTDSALCVWAER